MKFPTLSKTHMQQNVNLALSALVTQGISLEGTRGGVVTPRDIVEGHREKTFGLLWKLILNWKVAVLVDLSVLEAEIAALKAEYRRIYGVDQPDRVVSIYFDGIDIRNLVSQSTILIMFLNISVPGYGVLHFRSAVGASSLVSSYWSVLQSLYRQLYNIICRWTWIRSASELLPSYSSRYDRDEGLCPFLERVQAGKRQFCLVLLWLVAGECIDN